MRGRCRRMSASLTRTGGTGGAAFGFKVGLALCASMLIAGCATAPKDPEARASFEEANDPIEPTNRAILDVNLALDDAVIKPTAKAYRTVPEFVRKGLHNMIDEARAPVLFANFVLQGDMGAAATTVMRFVYNGIAGVGGFFDAAGSTGLPLRDTDFGITLAKWGAPDGPYLMLPLFGPSNPRDTVGLVADSFIDPIGYFATFWQSAGRSAFEGIDKREPNIEPLEEIQRTSVDFYAALRSLYRQRREDAIRGGQGGANIPAPSISYEEDNAAQTTKQVSAKPAQRETTGSRIPTVQP